MYKETDGIFFSLLIQAYRGVTCATIEVRFEIEKIWYGIVCQSIIILTQLEVKDNNCSNF